ncbi:unnamed protein product [Ectocarpus sp. 8 AP-2014]
MSTSLLDMDTSKLYAQVMKREREASQAVGKDYAARPASYKGSLSLKLDRYTQRRKSRSRSPDRQRTSGGGGSKGERRAAEPSPPRRKAAPVMATEITSLEWEAEHADVKGGGGYGCKRDNGGVLPCLSRSGGMMGLLKGKTRRAWDSVEPTRDVPVAPFENLVFGYFSLPAFRKKPTLLP